jgi:hypothetical protein
MEQLKPYYLGCHLEGLGECLHRCWWLHRQYFVVKEHCFLQMLRLKHSWHPQGLSKRSVRQTLQNLHLARNSLSCSDKQSLRNISDHSRASNLGPWGAGQWNLIVNFKCLRQDGWRLLSSYRWKYQRQSLREVKKRLYMPMKKLTRLNSHPVTPSSSVSLSITLFTM